MQVIDAMRRGLFALRFRTGRRGLRAAVLPSRVHAAMVASLRPDLVVDVGANRGQFSLDVRSAAPSARIVAFEPLESEATVFRRIFADDADVALRRCALGREPGQQILHVSRQPDNSSLRPIGARQMEFFGGTEKVAEQLVEVETLDSVALQIRSAERVLLKIDVQGGELDVLSGGAEILDHVRWIYVEVSFVELYEGQPLADEVIAFLGARDFGLVHVGPSVVRRGRAVQVDLLFENQRIDIVDQGADADVRRSRS